MFKILLHLLPKHGFERFEDFIFVVLLEHISKFRDFLAFLAANLHVVVIDLELDDVFGWRFELNSTKLVVAF